MCERCQADPQPSNFLSPRKCAFDNHGKFDPDNWSCATLSHLVDVSYAWDNCIYGADESLQPVLCDPERDGGWVVLTRYKTRGRVSSAIWVGDFFPPREVTLELVERALAYHVRPTNYDEHAG